MSILLGSIVRDKVTGLEGVADNRATYMYGCDRYWVQPRIKEDGTIPQGRMVDYPQLEFISSPVMDAFAEPEQIIELGQQVSDNVTGIKGVATGRAVYLNGCSRILIQPKSKDGVVEPASVWVDEKQVKGKTTIGGGPVVKTAPDTRGSRSMGGPAPACSAR